MITQLISFAGAQTGPFARCLAQYCTVVLAVEPGERVSTDISGRTRLRLLPSGVFFPTVENLLPAQTRFSMEDWEKDSRALSAKGYGPVKIRLDPRCVPEADREAVKGFLSHVEPESWIGKGDLLIEGEAISGCRPERVICVLGTSALSDPGLPDFLESHRVTQLALFGAEKIPSGLPLPLWAWTEASAPMKVRSA